MGCVGGWGGGRGEGCPPDFCFMARMSIKPAVAICLRCDREPYFKGSFVGRGVWGARGQLVNQTACVKTPVVVLFATVRAR